MIKIYEQQKMLGICYEYGRGVKRDFAEAMKHYRMAARDTHRSLSKYLGIDYKLEAETDEACLELANSYKKAADQGDSEAQVIIGLYYIHQYPRRREAFEWYRKAAEQGNAVGQRLLGVCYEYGLGTWVDSVEAFNCYCKAAAQGDSEAQRLLGICYECGYGVKQNYDEAVKWYRKSAAQGNTCVLKRLGDCYCYGYGVEKDSAEAIKLYTQAAAQGDEYAKFQLSALT